MKNQYNLKQLLPDSISFNKRIEKTGGILEPSDTR